MRLIQYYRMWEVYGSKESKESKREVKGQMSYVLRQKAIVS